MKCGDYSYLRAYNEIENATALMIRNIVFDFDGTLVDTAPLIVATMRAAIAELGLPARTEAECRATIGLRLEEIPAALWPDRDDISAPYAATYRRIFEELKRPLSVSCFPGVAETVRKLRASGFGMAIASSRSHKSLDEYIGLFGLTSCFEMVVGGDDVANGKPAPDPVLAITDNLGWNVGETLVVGDAVYDIEMGRNAGTRTCAVTYGNGSLAELRSVAPDAIIDTFSALPDIVAEF